MSVIIASGVLVRLVWARAALDHAVNVLHYRWPPSVSVDQTSAESIKQGVSASLVASGLLAYLTTDVSLVRVGIRDRRSPNLPLIEAVAANAGTSALEQLPPDTSMVVTLRTALAGRSFRGRTFLSGFTIAANTATGGIEPAAMVAADAFLTGISSIAVGGAQAILSVASQVRNKLPIEPGLMQDVTSILVRDSVWDRQARRATPGI